MNKYSRHGGNAAMASAAGLLPLQHCWGAFGLAVLGKTVLPQSRTASCCTTMLRGNLNGGKELSLFLAWRPTIFKRTKMMQNLAAVKKIHSQELRRDMKARFHKERAFAFQERRPASAAIKKMARRSRDLPSQKGTFNATC
ncbi:hypothetical protein RY831_07895 [Noviherbaspirillum sp. CPCC 100848]|uniref:30S ribosomal protein S21 n=2 Tax=Noviherbaspirillum album TaxID=3080276 RepID=A0ABU6J616_9BURK|nr:hypothetical protein [Noviherbaspirillum sp. CPCC 100848]